MGSLSTPESAIVHRLPPVTANEDGYIPSGTEPPHFGNPLTCTECGKIFTNGVQLDRHLKYHRTMGKQRYQCPYCNKICTFAANLKKHLRIHTGEKPFECKVCPYRTGDPSSLARHCRNHTESAT